MWQWWGKKLKKKEQAKESARIPPIPKGRIKGIVNVGERKNKAKHLEGDVHELAKMLWRREKKD